MGFALLLLVVGLLLIAAVAAWVGIRTLQTALSPGQELGRQLISVLQPTPTIRPDPVTIVHEVQGLKQLSTVSYTVEKVITAEEGQGAFSFLFGDKLLFVAHGKVVAGVDMAKMSEGDLHIVGDHALVVTLPPAEVFSAYLESDKSYVYDRRTGVLRGSGDKNLESSARRVAEQKIEQAALDDGILPLAQKNAEDTLRSLFGSLGYTQVSFLEGTPGPTTTPGGISVTVGPAVTPLSSATPMPGVEVTVEPTVSR